MILKNPTNQDIAIVYFGKAFEILKGGTLEVPDEVGKHWKGKIHGFLEVQEIVKTVETKVTESTEPVEPVIKKETKPKK